MDLGAYTTKFDITEGWTILGVEIETTFGASQFSAHRGVNYKFYYDQKEGKLVIGNIQHFGIGFGGKSGATVKIPLQRWYEFFNEGE